MEYKRLTERVKNTSSASDKYGGELVQYKYGKDKTLAECLVDILGRLADLEDMIESNKLVYKPYNTGDHVFYSDRSTLEVTEFEIHGFRGDWDIDTGTALFAYTAHPIERENGLCYSRSDGELRFNTSNIGTIIFSTMEEATENLKN